jgi:hypothetical protein
MLLYRHLPQTSLQPRSESENRLRDVLLTAALTTLEIGATLDTLPSLSSWAWYSTTYQQYHAVLLLLTELYRTPDLPRKDRMMTMIDHIFGHCYGVSVRERCSDLLWTVKENLEAFYVMKGFNKKRQNLAPQQHPTLQPLPSFSSTSPNFVGQTPRLPQGPQGHLQRTSTLDNLNVDFDSILGSLHGGGSGEDYDIFGNMNGGNVGGDSNAIFVPVDSGAQGSGDFGTTSPNGGMQQWVSSFNISWFVRPIRLLMRRRKIGISPTRSRSLRIKCRFSTVLCIDFLTLMQKGDAMGSCIVGPRYDCTGDTVITKGGCVTFTRKMRPWLLSSQKTMKNDKRVLLTRIGVQCLWFGHSILEAVCSSLSSESACACHVEIIVMLICQGWPQLHLA